MSRTSGWIWGCAWQCALALGSGCTGSYEVAQLGTYEGEANEGTAPAGSEGASAAPAPGPQCASPGCVAEEPIGEAEPNAHCFELKAHSPADRARPWEVVPGSDEFVAFTYADAAEGARYIRSIEAMIRRDAAVLRGMRLYQHDAITPAGVRRGPTRLGGMELIYAWTPGGRGLFLDSGLGIPLHYGSLTIELHYVRAEGLPAEIEDHSGMRVCTTSEDVAYPVSFAVLGQQEFSGSSAEGLCTPAASGPIRLLAMQAIMNIAGERTKLSVERASGELAVLVDKPFVFSDPPLTRLSQAQVAPGDRLLSTCGFSRSVVSGPGGRDELCELHVLHWPAAALTSAGAPDACWN